MHNKVCVFVGPVAVVVQKTISPTQQSRYKHRRPIAGELWIAELLQQYSRAPIQWSSVSTAAIIVTAKILRPVFLLFSVY